MHLLPLTCIYSHALIIQQFVKVSTETFISLSRALNLSWRARAFAKISYPFSASRDERRAWTTLCTRLRLTHATTYPLCDRKHCVIVTRARVVSRVGGPAGRASAMNYTSRMFSVSNLHCLNGYRPLFLTAGAPLYLSLSLSFVSLLPPILSPFAGQKRRNKMYDFRIRRRV